MWPGPCKALAGEDSDLDEASEARVISELGLAGPAECHSQFGFRAGMPLTVSL